MLEGPMYFNDAKVAKIAIKSMQSRPHKGNASLREAGILEFKFVRDKKKRQKTLEEGVSAEQTCEIDDPEDYVAVRNHMADSANPGKSNPADVIPPKRKRTGPGARDPPLPPNPEEAKLKELRAEATKSMQGMKSTFDRIQRDLSEVAVIEGRLKARKWNSEGPLAYLRAETEKITELNGQLFAAWAEAKQAIDFSSETSHQALEDHKAKMDADAKKTLDAYKKYAKETLSEFAKMK
eukprot:9481530-Pyramimonas_sp.AAC.4